MKPTKNKYFCPDCGRTKMRFETEKEANTFLKFNADEIEEETGKRPIRSYYCIACNSWHITSKKEPLIVKSRTESVLERYQELKQGTNIVVKDNNVKRDTQKERNSTLEAVNSKIKETNSKLKEAVLKETKEKRDGLNELLRSVKINIEIINNLLKFGKQYKCMQIIDDSFCLIDSFNKTILELEIDYESKINRGEIIEIFSERKKRKNDLENTLNILKLTINNS